jgi:CheY-like chemotaxis protein
LDIVTAITSNHNSESDRERPDMTVHAKSDARKCILIVDDDVFYRNLVSWILEDAGYQVTTAENFFAAIKIIESDQRVHLLLADLQMPVGTPNGVAIGRMVRLRRHKLPIVYMTGFYDPGKIRVIEPDIPILSKPFTGQDLLRMIEGVLNPAEPRRRPQTALPRPPGDLPQPPSG